MKIQYMHLVYGYPAQFSVQHKLILLAQSRDRVRLVPSLKQIRAEQKACIATRIAYGYDADPADYGYALVRVVRS